MHLVCENGNFTFSVKGMMHGYHEYMYILENPSPTNHLLIVPTRDRESSGKELTLPERNGSCSLF